jgi:nitrile hydratase accessory protein
MRCPSPDQAAAEAALEAVPEAPRDPVFNEPWEAQAFALMVALRRRGVFTADEWATALGDEILAAQAAGDPDRGDTYYRHWLRAIERLVQQKGIATGETLERYREAWHHAAGRTPHGQPVTLAPGDFA